MIQVQDFTLHYSMTLKTREILGMVLKIAKQWQRLLLIKLVVYKELVYNETKTNFSNISHWTSLNRPPCTTDPKEAQVLLKSLFLWKFRIILKNLNSHNFLNFVTKLSENGDVSVNTEHFIYWKRLWGENVWNRIQGNLK